MTSTQDPGPDETTTSAARIAANRRNAQKSTGPRSPEGKRRSSENATRHGAFSERGFPVRIGLFAEDPEEVDAYQAGIVQALDPRDDVEDAQAQLVALRYLQVRRLARFEAESLSTAGTVTGHEHRSVLDDQATAADRLETARMMLHVVSGTAPEHNPDYRALANFVEVRRRLSWTSRDLWKDHPLDSPEDWEWAFNALLAHVWGTDLSAAADWAHREVLEWQCELGRLDGRALARGTERVLEILDRVTTYDARIQRSLERALRDNRYLQARSLPAPEGAPSPDHQPANQPRVLSIDEIKDRETNPISDGGSSA
jgi:hypothetical protein